MAESKYMNTGGGQYIIFDKATTSDVDKYGNTVLGDGVNFSLENPIIFF